MSIEEFGGHAVADHAQCIRFSLGAAFYFQIFLGRPGGNDWNEFELVGDGGNSAEKPVSPGKGAAERAPDSLDEPLIPGIQAATRSACLSISFRKSDVHTAFSESSRIQRKNVARYIMVSAFSSIARHGSSASRCAASRIHCTVRLTRNNPENW